MNAITIRDLFGRIIEIPEERWRHVCQQHPELVDLISEMKETLEDPDVIKSVLRITKYDCIINSIQVYLMVNTFL
jgi:hypothetical protein